ALVARSSAAAPRRAAVGDRCLASLREYRLDARLSSGIGRARVCRPLSPAVSHSFHTHCLARRGSGELMRKLGLPDIRWRTSLTCALAATWLACGAAVAQTPQPAPAAPVLVYA